MTSFGSEKPCMMNSGDEQGWEVKALMQQLQEAHVQAMLLQTDLHEALNRNASMLGKANADLDGLKLSPMSLNKTIHLQEALTRKHHHDDVGRLLQSALETTMDVDTDMGYAYQAIKNPYCTAFFDSHRAMKGQVERESMPALRARYYTMVAKMAGKADDVKRVDDAATAVAHHGGYGNYSKKNKSNGSTPSYGDDEEETTHEKPVARRPRSHTITEYAPVKHESTSSDLFSKTAVEQKELKEAKLNNLRTMASKSPRGLRLPVGRVRQNDDGDDDGKSGEIHDPDSKDVKMEIFKNEEGLAQEHEKSMLEACSTIVYFKGSPQLCTCDGKGHHNKKCPHFGLYIDEYSLPSNEEELKLIKKNYQEHLQDIGLCEEVEELDYFEEILTFYINKIKEQRNQKNSEENSHNPPEPTMTAKNEEDHRAQVMGIKEEASGNNKDTCDMKMSSEDQNKTSTGASDASNGTEARDKVLHSLKPLPKLRRSQAHRRFTALTSLPEALYLPSPAATEKVETNQQPTSPLTLPPGLDEPRDNISTTTKYSEDVEGLYQDVQQLGFDLQDQATVASWDQPAMEHSIDDILPTEYPTKPTTNKRDNCGIIKLSEDDDGSSIVYAPKPIRNKTLKELLLEDTTDEDTTMSEKAGKEEKSTASYYSPSYSSAHTRTEIKKNSTEYHTDMSTSASINTAGTNSGKGKVHFSSGKTNSVHEVSGNMKCHACMATIHADMNIPSSSTGSSSDDLSSMHTVHSDEQQ